jgi:hypothetical protein
MELPTSELLGCRNARALYSSLISEWRRLRNFGVLAGKDSGANVGAPSAEQAEICRLRRELADRKRRLATTETTGEQQPPSCPVVRMPTIPPKGEQAEQYNTRPEHARS